ncbi:Two-component system response regulator protein [Olavius algarvensis associated proteobacterium Delta 3]|nr:Two-component system response regulator protein [Olavius algarvensis associated proteobacterium Delta 3]
MARILIIESDFSFWTSIQDKLEVHHAFHLLPLGKDLRRHLLKNYYDLILLNFSLTGESEFSSLEEIQLVSPHTPIIAMSEFENADLIVRTMKKGVFDFLVKPFTTEKILLCIKRGLEHRHLKHEIDYLKHSQEYIYDFDQIVSVSPVMKRVIATLRKFSRTDATVLITGETGTGKSFLSGAVHYNSSRKKKPFIKINCANLPESLLESELFGHEKGAFTGADRTRVGRLEQARGGTIFLDEIGELSGSIQAKMLRVLEEKSFERIGGNKTIYSDVRIIAATNRKPEEQVASGAFREDLYYRLNVLRIHLPPLRERKECIEPLSQFLLNRICRNLRKNLEGFSPDAEHTLRNYFWPGNIRELANIIERAAILEEEPLIRAEHIRLSELLASGPDNDSSEIGDNNTRTADFLSSREKENIIQALESCLWIQKDAAHRLGISPRALNYKIKKLGITHPRWLKNK